MTDMAHASIVCGVCGMESDVVVRKPPKKKVVEYGDPRYTKNVKCPNCGCATGVKWADVQMSEETFHGKLYGSD